MTTTYTLSGVRKTQGRDFNFYWRGTINWSNFGGSSLDGASPDIFIPFPTRGIMLLNEDNSGNGVEISLNGSAIHDRLDPTVGVGSKAIAYDNRTMSLIWLRIANGSTSAVFSIRAWQ